MDIKFVVITAMNKDELTFMKEYVITLESENDSKNRERAMLQRQLDSLLNENNQLRLLRPSNDSQIIVEKNAEISTLIKQIQDQNREIQLLKSQKNAIQSNIAPQFMDDISLLKQEFDGFQMEVARARKEFATKQSDWDSERRSYLSEIAQLKANLTASQNQGDIRSEFDKLIVGYSKLEMELNNRISQLQASTRVMESEKNKITHERDNHKQEKDILAARVTDLERQQNNRIGSTQASDSTHRVAELNLVIADLNNQLQVVMKERDFQRQRQATVRLDSKEQDRGSQLASLVEALNNDRIKMKADFDIVCIDRDLLQSVVVDLEREKSQLTAQLSIIANQRAQGSQSGLSIDQAGQLDSVRQERDRFAARVFELERERVARTSQLPSKDNEWLKEKGQLLLEITNLKKENNSVGWIINDQNRRIDDLQKQNMFIQGQFQANEQQLSDYRRKEDIVRKDIQHLNSEIDRLSKLADSKRSVDVELSKLKTQVTNLINTNSLLQNQLNILKQSNTYENANDNEINRIMQNNAQLEHRVYVLEAANYKLKEEINKNLYHSRGNTGVDHLIQALKSELMEVKLENEKLVQINHGIQIDYKECSEKLKLEIMQRQNRVRDRSNTRSRMTRQPDVPPQNIQNMYTRAEYNQRLLSEPIQGVFQQRWESNDNQRHQNKPYGAQSTERVDVSKWTNIQKKINALKMENDELKKSLNFTPI